VIIPTAPAGIVDLIALQNAIVLFIASDSRLANVPILQEIKLLSESDLQEDALWTLPRSCFSYTPNGVTVTPNQGQPGLTGAGIEVEMVSARCASTNVSGPPLSWELDIVAFEERNTNFLAGTGIGITSEQLILVCFDILQGLEIAPFGTFKVTASPLQAARDKMDLYPGIFAYRGLMETGSVGRTQTNRSQPAAITFVSDTCTLTCSDNLASVFYTTDSSMPVAANPNAVAYTIPFAVPSGTKITSSTSRSGFVNSQIWQATAP
jgi:hypothetical protein